MLVKVDDPINDLTSIVANHALCKRSEVMQDLIQAAPSHPLNEDVDVALMLRGPQAADDVWVRETAEHGDLFLQPLQLFLLVRFGVPNIADLEEEGDGNNIT
jgi:hypothetical protein